MYAARNSLNAWPFTGEHEYYGILKYATEETSSRRATIDGIKCRTMAISVVTQTGERRFLQRTIAKKQRSRHVASLH